MVVVTLAVLSFLNSPPKDELVGTSSNKTTGEDASLLSHRTFNEQQVRRDESLSTFQRNSDSKRRRLKDKSRVSKQSGLKDLDEPLSDKKKESEQLSAKQWFEKGYELDDDSEAEIECYLKAKELDPKFAPASFRLAAIYFRQANYELADREFASFLKNATDEDRQNYDIYVFYSSADVERLSAAIAQQASEEVKKTGNRTRVPFRRSGRRRHRTRRCQTRSVGRSLDRCGILSGKRTDCCPCNIQ